MTPQCAFRNVCHEVGRCGTGVGPPLSGSAEWSNGPRVADVLQGALDPRVTPRRILLRHPHDKPSNLHHDAAPPRLAGVRPFLCNQLSMPAQQRVRRRDRGDHAQGRTAHAVRPRSQPSAIVVGETQSPGPQLAAAGTGSLRSGTRLPPAPGGPASRSAHPTPSAAPRGRSRGRAYITIAG